MKLALKFALLVMVVGFTAPIYANVDMSWKEICTKQKKRISNLPAYSLKFSPRLPLDKSVVSWPVRWREFYLGLPANDFGKPFEPKVHGEMLKEDGLIFGKPKHSSFFIISQEQENVSVSSVLVETIEKESSLNIIEFSDESLDALKSEIDKYVDPQLGILNAYFIALENDPSSLQCSDESIFEDKRLLLIMALKPRLFNKRLTGVYKLERPLKGFYMVRETKKKHHVSGGVVSKNGTQYNFGFSLWKSVGFPFQNLFPETLPTDYNNQHSDWLKRFEETVNQ